MTIPNVGMRKAIPKPFKRKSITVSDGVKREWREVQPHLLMPGDIIAGHGVVHPGGEIKQWIERDPWEHFVEIKLLVGAPEPHEYYVRYRFGRQQMSQTSNALELVGTVLAFTKAAE